VGQLLGQQAEALRPWRRYCGPAAPCRRLSGRTGGKPGEETRVSIILHQLPPAPSAQVDHEAELLNPSATQILLRQAPQAIDTVGDAFGLTAGERRLLLSARRGQGLLLAGTHRSGFEAIASTIEHALATDSPEFDESSDDSRGNFGVDEL
jgi:hypothetical protein